MMVRLGQPSPSGLSRVDAMACLYLALPIPFFAAWFKWPVAMLLCLLLLLGMHSVLKDIRWAAIGKAAGLPMVALLALVWTALAGSGHFFYANDDWLTRDAVLRDLVATSWPPRYEESHGVSLILRAPLAYYLPAAGVGSLLGLFAADMALYAWTLLGFTLFLWTAMTLFPAGRQRWVAMGVLMGFGGLDLIGASLMKGALPQPGDHLEWWAVFAQYSSNPTMLFWVPNHALPSWLGIALILRHWKTPDLMRIAPWLLAATPLWSPLATVGLLPFLVAGLNWKIDTWKALSIRSVLPWFGIALLLAAYVTMDADSVPGGWALSGFDSMAEFLKSYVAFVILEFGLLLFILSRLNSVELPLGVAAVVLLVLPLYRFGVGNDLVMRSSIPALTVLALATIRPLTTQAGHPVWRATLALVLLLGAMGSLQEPIRALRQPRWGLKDITLQQVVDKDYRGILPPHYVAWLQQPMWQAMLRQPTQVQPSASSP